jgi:hypothetical protein
MARADLEEMLVRLAAAPDDGDLRVRVAMELTRRDRHGEAAALLGEGFVNLTAHDGPTLPCLCRRCLQPELGHAQAEGMGFVRRFAVAHGRVLWFWVPHELADDPGLMRGIVTRLAGKLAS